MQSGRRAAFQVGLAKNLESRDQQRPRQFFFGRSYRWLQRYEITLHSSKRSASLVTFRWSAHLMHLETMRPAL